MLRADGLLVILIIASAACGLDPAPATAGRAAGSATVTGDPVQTLVQDAAIFDSVRRIIGGAGRRLDVEMYEFGRTDLADLLGAARARGVPVRVVLDPTVAQDRPVAARLTAAGVSVRWYPVDDHRRQIDHVKLLIDDRTALVGGMNWGGHSAANHDYAVEDGDQADLRRLSAIFGQDWSLAGGWPAPLNEMHGPIAQTAPGREIRQRLESAIAASKTSISAEVFALTDPDIISGLAAAQRRGVRVRVLLDPGEDVNHASFTLLMRAGVAVAWFPVARGAKLHAKIGAFDDLLVLGSANWSRHGLGVNHELDLATARHEAVAAYKARFEKDWEVALRVAGATRWPGASTGSSSASSCACACASSCAAS